MEIEEVEEQIRGFGCSHVVVTGGEPLLQEDLDQLCRSIRDKHVTIETNATVYRDVDVDLVSVSPKLSNSAPPEDDDWHGIHEEKRLDFDVIEDWISDNSTDYQLKFVVSDEEDLSEIEEILESVEGYDDERVLLMPEGTDRDTLRKRGSWLSEVCMERGYRYSPRLHIHLYGNERRT